jgi:hypothetical protein
MTVLSEQRLCWVVLFANLIFGVHYMTVTTPHGSAIKGLKSASQVALLLVPDLSHHSLAASSSLRISTSLFIVAMLK